METTLNSVKSALLTKISDKTATIGVVGKNAKLDLK
jgi:hypothetical protein